MKKLSTEDTIELKEIFEVILREKVPSKNVNAYIKNSFGDNLTNGQMIAIGQVLKASNERDTSAAVFIRDTLGQKPTDKQEISGSKENPFVVSLDSKLEQWSK